ncbi:MAG: DUF4397 domain-containing protein, partial [Gemmatimonadaceae bacterium]|nr:DUF4397 domain-containing protein [Gemmatimonadaceae bacterium]
MRFKMIPVLGLVVLGASACKNDSGVTGPKPIPPAALIRFVNATVDTGIVDFRFIDKVENLPTFLGVKFRGSSGGYQRVQPGSRPVRIFVNSSNPVEAQKRLVDTTITLAADTRYTLVYMGQARGNNDRLLVLTDPATFPTPAAGNIAVRMFNADPALGSADVWVARSDTTNPVTKPATTFTGVAVQSYSPYKEVPAASSTTLYKFAVAPSGAGTPSYTDTPNVPGAAAPAGASYGPQPGVRIAGSVLTAVISGTPTAGSPAASTANQATSTRVVLLSDKLLNP